MPIFRNKMELENCAGSMMSIRTINDRSYIGTVGFLSSPSLTITLINAWSGEDFFETIIIKATDILGFSFVQEAEKKQPASKNYKKRPRFVQKKVLNK